MADPEELSRRTSEGSPSGSANDSLNSLIKEYKNDANCIDICMDVDCSLTNQCSMDCDEDIKTKKRRNICCNSVGRSVWGVLLIFISIGGLIFTPLDFMLWEKLNMRPGFPPYDWWSDPPDEVKMRVYIFNVTNHERFLQGLDEKINMEEVGPIVYLEKLLHRNIVFNDNSTMTYTAQRFLKYLPAENYVDMNASLVVPNMAVLGLSSYLHNAPYLVRTAFRLLVNTRGSDFFTRKTVYEFLWDYRDSVLDTSQSLVPGLVPVNNMGILTGVYKDFTDNVTVFMGPQWGHERFFQIEKYDGNSHLPFYDPQKCPDRLLGSTEGVMYKQHINKNDTLLYWRKTACKVMPLYYAFESLVEGIPVYRFNLSEVAFNRVKNGTDCYDTEPTLPDGVSDASKCFYDFPIVVSYPHFYTGSPPLDTYVTGLKPDREKHNSYAYVEPLSGTPLKSVARMQSNMKVQDLSGFSSEYDKFSNLILPLIWLEYDQKDLPSKMKLMIYFMVVVLPPLSCVFLSIMLILGCYLLGKIIYKQNHNLKQKCDVNDTLTKNKIFAYEKKAFLKRDK